MLLANSNLVPRWSTWEHFNELDRKGLMMYGQMTAGSWIYIGSQGIVQGTYETFVEMGRQHYGGSLAGRWLLTAGLGGMGGAQPLASVMAGASCLAIECQRSRIDMRLKSGYLDHATDDIDEALDAHRRARCDEKRPISVGLLGNAAEVLPELFRRGVRPDCSPTRPPPTIPSTAIYPSAGPWSNGSSTRASDPAAVARGRQGVDGRARALHARFPEGRRAHRRLRQQHPPGGARGRREERLRFPGLRARLHPAAVLPRRRAVPLGRAVGRSRRHREDRCARSKNCCPTTSICITGSTWRSARIQFQGLPARICWVGLGDRHRLGLAFNEMVASGELKAPIVIGRDHLDSGSVASPNRETEGMRDGSDAVSDWPLLNALLNTASGATWVSIHHGGGVGMGFSQHAGVVIVCDGTEAAAKRIARVLWNDPATRRHAPRGRGL